MRHTIFKVFLGLGLATVLVLPIICLDEGLEPSAPSQEEIAPEESVTEPSAAIPEEAAEAAPAEVEPQPADEPVEAAPVEVNSEPAAQPAQEVPAPVTQPAVAPKAMPAVPPAKVSPAQPVAASAATPGAAPLPAQPAQEGQPEKVGIDTLSINEQGGNWLLKRIWYEKALQRYEKIKNLVDEVLDSRTAFFNKRTELDRTLFEPFFNEIGLEMGELQAIINDYVAKLDELRKKEGGALNSEELEFANRVGAEKEELEQAQADVKTVIEVDNALDDALAKLMEQINLCRNYEKQALQNFKEIAKILDDKKARDLYYEMETHLSNIKAILDYIQHPFAQHFTSLETKSRELTDRITKSVHLLKEKGIEFKSKAKELEDESNKRNGEGTQSEGFGASIMNGFSYVGGLVSSSAQWLWNGISSAFNWVRSLFGGTEVNESPASDTKESTKLKDAEMATPAAPIAIAAEPQESAPAMVPAEPANAVSEAPAQAVVTP